MTHPSFYLISAQSVQSMPRHYHDFKCSFLNYFSYVFNAVVNYLWIINVNLFYIFEIHFVSFSFGILSYLFSVFVVDV